MFPLVYRQTEPEKPVNATEENAWVSIQPKQGDAMFEEDRKQQFQQQLTKMKIRIEDIKGKMEEETDEAQEKLEVVLQKIDRIHDELEGALTDITPAGTTRGSKAVEGEGADAMEELMFSLEELVNKLSEKLDERKKNA